MKILRFIGKIIVFIVETLLNWNQFWSIPLALALVYYTPWIMRVSGFDPTVGEMDGALLFKPIFAMVYVLLLSGVSWIYTKMVFPALYKYKNEFFKTDFKNLEPWQKILVSLFVPFFFLLLSVLALNAI